MLRLFRNRSKDTDFMSLEGGQAPKDHEDHGNKADSIFTKRPRLTPNGDIALPFSTAFVLKKITNFDATNCSVDCALTMILRIKLTGVDQMFAKAGLDP